MATEKPEDMMPGRFALEDIETTEWRGLFMPFLKGRDINEHFEKTLNMDIRDDDVILAAFPKCGSHWTWRIMDMLLQQTAEYADDRFADKTFIDIQPAEKVANAKSPRILNTHLPLHYMPYQAVSKRTKIVHVYRNPKAAVVSMYFMLRNLGTSPDLTLDKMEAIMTGRDDGPKQDICLFLDSVIKFEKEHPDYPIFSLAYEDLKQDTAGWVEKLGQFLGVPTSPDLCAAIADAVSFKTQKQRESEMGPPLEAALYRKGEVDDWKNHMTVAQNEHMDAILKERAPTCRFSAKYVTSA